MNDKMPYINRDEQFNKVDGLFTWYDEIINIYEAAFWVHYRILNNHIETWISAISDEDIMPRMLYFVNTEYMSMVFAELLLTLEVLFKAELIRSGLGITDVKNVSHGGHGIIDLLNKMDEVKDDRCNHIAKMFDNCKKDLKYADDKKVFVYARYIDWDRFQLDEQSALIIKKIVKVLDKVYMDYYEFINIEHLLYLGMEAGFGESDFTEDEVWRLKKLDLLEN